MRKQIVSKFKLNPFTVVVTKHVWPYFQSRFPKPSFQTCFFLVGIAKVHYLYLNPQICKYQIFITDILSPVEFSMYAKGFRYKKYTHLTVGTVNEIERILKLLLPLVTSNKSYSKLYK